MNQEIKVHVVKYPDRANLVMRYLCPMTNKQVTRTTGTNKKREAERVAAKWEADLRSGRYQKRSRMDWDSFRHFYDENKLSTVKSSTARNIDATFNAFTKHCNPKTIADLTTERVTMFATALRKPVPVPRKPGETRTLTEASVGKHLRHLKAIARWANRQGFLEKIPNFDMPGRSSGAMRMKGRPITLEEFERMLAVTPRIVGDNAAESWRLLLRGLWASGLRLGEAMSLRWDWQPGCVVANLDGQESVFEFDADSQKSGKSELVPMSPDAVRILDPLERSNGYVFTPERRDGKAMARHTLKIGKLISKIGKAAGVVVNPETGKFASAHDLRRAFCYRWARCMMPSDLQAIMRHASIQTTLTFYVGQDAKRTSKQMWAVSGNTPGNIGYREEEKQHARQDSNLRPAD